VGGSQSGGSVIALERAKSQSEADSGLVIHTNPLTTTPSILPLK
jgi:hypothetical protein